MGKMFLESGDLVGVTFWLVSIAMIASTVFFLYEGAHVKKEWRLSLLVAGLVTLVAGDRELHPGLQPRSGTMHTRIRTRRRTHAARNHRTTTYKLLEGDVEGNRSE